MAYFNWLERLVHKEAEKESQLAKEHLEANIVDAKAEGNKVQAAALDLYGTENGALLELTWHPSSYKLFSKEYPSVQDAQNMFNQVKGNLLQISKMLLEGAQDEAESASTALLESLANISTKPLNQTTNQPVTQTQASKIQVSILVPALSKEAKATVQNIFFSDVAELLKWQEAQKAAQPAPAPGGMPGAAPGGTPGGAALPPMPGADQKGPLMNTPASPSALEKMVDQRVQEKVESSLDAKARAIFEDVHAETVKVLRQLGRSWEEIKDFFNRYLKYDWDDIDVYLDQFIQAEQGTEDPGTEKVKDEMAVGDGGGPPELGETSPGPEVPSKPEILPAASQIAKVEKVGGYPEALGWTMQSLRAAQGEIKMCLEFLAQDDKDRAVQHLTQLDATISGDLDEAEIRKNKKMAELVKSAELVRFPDLLKKGDKVTLVRSIMTKENTILKPEVTGKIVQANEYSIVIESSEGTFTISKHDCSKLDKTAALKELCGPCSQKGHSPEKDWEKCTWGNCTCSCQLDKKASAPPAPDPDVCDCGSANLMGGPDCACGKAQDMCGDCKKTLQHPGSCQMYARASTEPKECGCGPNEDCNLCDSPNTCTICQGTGIGYPAPSGKCTNCRGRGYHLATKEASAEEDFYEGHCPTCQNGDFFDDGSEKDCRCPDGCHLDVLDVDAALDITGEKYYLDPNAEYDWEADLIDEISGKLGEYQQEWKFTKDPWEIEGNGSDKPFVQVDIMGGHTPVAPDADKAPMDWAKTKHPETSVQPHDGTTYLWQKQNRSSLKEGDVVKHAELGSVLVHSLNPLKVEDQEGNFHLVKAEKLDFSPLYKLDEKEQEEHERTMKLVHPKAPAPKASTASLDIEARGERQKIRELKDQLTKATKPAVIKSLCDAIDALEGRMDKDRDRKDKRREDKASKAPTSVPTSTPVTASPKEYWCTTCGMGLTPEQNNTHYAQGHKIELVDKKAELKKKVSSLSAAAGEDYDKFSFAAPISSSEGSPISAVESIWQQANPVGREEMINALNIGATGANLQYVSWDDLSDEVKEKLTQHMQFKGHAVQE